MAEGQIVAVDPPVKSQVGFGRGRGLEPQDLDGAWRCAKLVASSGLAPKGMERPEAILVAAAMGAEVGLTFMQALQNIAVVNGRPAIWGDALLALVEGTGELAEYQETYEGTPYQDDFAAVVRAVRRRPNGTERKTEERFSVADAKTAGLWKKPGPWTQYPRRMLRYRARGFALRDLFPDVLKGVRSAEEAMDTPVDPIVPGPGRPFEVEELASDPAPQPVPEAPVAPRAPESQAAPETASAPQPLPVGQGPTEPALATRRRTNPYTRADGAPVKTAGIFLATLEQIEALRDAHPQGAETVRAFLDALPIRNKDLTYLREEEGLVLLEQLRALRAPAGPEPDAPSPTDDPPPFADGELVRSAPGVKPEISQAVVVRTWRAQSGRWLAEVRTSEDVPTSRWYCDQLVADTSAAPEAAVPPPPDTILCQGVNAGDRVSAHYCSERCRERDDCPEFRTYQEAHVDTAAPADNGQSVLFGEEG